MPQVLEKLHYKIKHDFGTQPMEELSKPFTYLTLSDIMLTGIPGGAQLFHDLDYGTQDCSKFCLHI